MSQLVSDYQTDSRTHHCFEGLLGAMLVCFAGATPDAIDGHIGEMLRRVCECFGLDAASLWQVRTSTDELRMSHVFRAFEEDSVPGTDANAMEVFPWHAMQLRAGRTVSFSSLDELPVEAAVDVHSFKTYGVSSACTIPLVMGTQPAIGAISFDSMSRPTIWSDQLLERLRTVAQVVANAIVRKRQDMALRQSETRLSLAADSAGTGLWSLDLASQRYWVTPAARAHFGLGPDELVTKSLILQFVLAEDRPLVEAAMDIAIQSGREQTVEYRIRRRDGSERWMLSLGRIHRDSAGEPRELMGASQDITERKLNEKRLHESLAEVTRLREQLGHENVYLRREVSTAHGRSRIIGQSQTLRHAIEQVDKVADTLSTVLLLGETGTGKELFASAIHERSPRRDRAMVAVNCAALPSPLLESELFGREKGAYTGALTKQIGRFELANGSTLFLDEVAELPPELQVKLLRALQEREIERLGSPRPIKIDVRVIAATNRELSKAVREGKFREDLYYRLNVFPITVPPLRDRRDDIPQLVWAFVEEFSRSMGKNIASIPQTNLDELCQHSWPGNVRELRNAVERAMILATGPTLRIEFCGAPAPLGETDHVGMREVERAHILKILAQTGWRIRGATGAAAVLGMKPTTLESRMAKLRITRPRLGQQT